MGDKTLFVRPGHICPCVDQPSGLGDLSVINSFGFSNTVKTIPVSFNFGSEISESSHLYDP